MNEQVVTMVDNEYIDNQRRLSTLPCYLNTHNIWELPSEVFTWEDDLFSYSKG